MSHTVHRFVLKLEQIKLLLKTAKLYNEVWLF